MTERPILFSAPMVRAILDGRKTQTRRVVKLWNPPELKTHIIPPDLAYFPDFNCYRSTCPYGQIGDRLWVRETLKLKSVIDTKTGELGIAAYYAAGGEHQAFMWNGRRDVESIPSIHMPRWASRITLEITDVRVERLKDISTADAIAEGHDFSSADEYAWNPYAWFKQLWQSINGPSSWDANPWVWVIRFKRVEGGAA